MTQTPDKWLQVGCRLEMRFSVPSPMTLLLRPRSGTRQWVSRDSYLVDPPLPITEYTDLYGNLCQRLLAPAGQFRLDVESHVRVSAAGDVAPGAPFVPVDQLPADVLIYLAPSRYCESDSMLGRGADITSGLSLGYDQVAAISRWVHQRLHYMPGSDPVPVSSLEAMRRRNGVCRDFAHMGIALCRSLSIPARMVVGYLENLQPMDLHAWFEAFVGGQWYTFDPTWPDLQGGRVCLGYGRDAADVAVFSQFGPPVIPSVMQVHVNNLGGLGQ